MRYLLLLVTLCLCCCSQKSYHQAADQDMVDRVLNGMRLSYLATGLDAQELESKSHRNLAYRLALHLKSEPQSLQQILKGDDVESSLRQYARQSIMRVERQRPGYPIIPIFQTLLDSDNLESDQEILLLACTAQLIAESEIVADDPGLRR